MDTIFLLTPYFLYIILIFVGAGLLMGAFSLIEKTEDAYARHQRKKTIEEYEQRNIQPDPNIDIQTSMNDLKEILIREFPLKDRVESKYECYQICEQNYLMFADDLVKGCTIPDFLNNLKSDAFQEYLKNKNALIVVGQTDEPFCKYDLMRTFWVINEKKTRDWAEIVFLLRNIYTNEFYYNASYFALVQKKAGNLSKK